MGVVAVTSLKEQFQVNIFILKEPKIPMLAENGQHVMRDYPVCAQCMVSV